MEVQVAAGALWQDGPRAGVDPTPQATALCPPGGVALPRGLSTASPVESRHQVTFPKCVCLGAHLQCLFSLSS